MIRYIFNKKKPPFPSGKAALDLFYFRLFSAVAVFLSSYVDDFPVLDLRGEIMHFEEPFFLFSYQSAGIRLFGEYDGDEISQKGFYVLRPFFELVAQ